jgi:hypothetical protein
MKKLLLAMPVIVGIGCSNAQELEPLTLKSQCYEPKVLFAELKDKFNEIPVLRGESDRNGLTVLFMGPDKTYTIVLLEKSGKRACIIDSGESIKPVQTKRESKDL